jgi:Flp pilus assembly protein TadD
VLRIADWDFNWQNAYAFSTPIALPKGTTLHMRYVYDNSAANPRNPKKPPQRVRNGRTTTDEMGDLILQLLPANAEDARILEEDCAAKELHNVMSRELRHVQNDPNDAEAHFNLGVNYSTLGEFSKAVHHYQEAARLDPKNTWVRNNLGSVYRTVGRTGDAIAQYMEAIRLNPNDAKAHNNLGYVFLMQGKLAQASAQFDEALRNDPDLAEAENNLGVIALQQRDATRAATHFERALKADPKNALARNNLLFIKSQRDPPR